MRKGVTYLRRAVVCLIFSLHFGLAFLAHSFGLQSVLHRSPRWRLHSPPAPGQRRLSTVDEPESLIPEENPYADPNRESRSGVRYSEVVTGLNILFPPQDLEKRNAMSRTDGYWPFINTGKDPPKQFTYGEFDFFFFADLLDQAIDYFNEYHDENITSWDGKVFADIGSGTGRLVFASAALFPWKLCRGIEILPGIHDVAVQNLERCQVHVAEGESESDEDKDDETVWRSFGTSVGQDDWLAQLRGDFCEEDEEEEITGGGVDETDKSIVSPTDAEILQTEKKVELNLFLPIEPSNSSDARVPLAPVEFTCGSFTDPYTYFGDVDLVFVFSSCMSSNMMGELSNSIGRQCKPGTIIITTEFPLPLDGRVEALEDDPSMPCGSYKLELLDRLDGFVWLTGGHSTAYFHRVVSSLWEKGVGRREKPEIPLDVQAWRLVKAMEAGELSDSKRFLRDVYNNMAFHAFPEEWRPTLEDD